MKHKSHLSKERILAEREEAEEGRGEKRREEERREEKGWEEKGGCPSYQQGDAVFHGSASFSTSGGASVGKTASPR